MLPTRHVIASPNSCKTLSARIIGASEQKWTLFWFQGFQTLKSRTRHLHTIYIVRFFVVRWMAVMVMQYVIWKRQSIDLKHSWLVHIIPETTDIQVIIKIFVFFCPPKSDLWIRKIGKNTSIWPNRANHYFAIRASAKGIIFEAIVINFVTFFGLYARVNHHNGMKTLRIELINHVFWIGKIFLVPSKNAPTVHVIDVQIKAIARNLKRPKLVRHLMHTLLRIIRPSALMKTQSPHRGQFRNASQCMIILRHVEHRWAKKEIKIEFATIGRHGQKIFFAFAKIKFCSVTVVKKNAIRIVLAQAIKEWNRAIQWI